MRRKSINERSTETAKIIGKTPVFSRKRAFFNEIRQLAILPDLGWLSSPPKRRCACPSAYELDFCVLKGLPQKRFLREEERQRSKVARRAKCACSKRSLLFSKLPLIFLQPSRKTVAFTRKRRSNALRRKCEATSIYAKRHLLRRGNRCTRKPLSPEWLRLLDLKLLKSFKNA